MNLLDLVNEPIKLSIWFEILRKDGTTAKELTAKLKLKGTNIYYHLDQLKEKNIVIQEVSQITNTNLLQTTYRINSDLFSEKENPCFIVQIRLIVLSFLISYSGLRALFQNN
ncbi:MAG: hypothetical protein ACTSP3_03210 [Candidatus Heimdallarchaeaceae archaeon]